MIPDARPTQSSWKCNSKQDTNNQPSASRSCRSRTFSPKLRMSRSMRSGFRLISGWPYQYTRGRSAFDDRMVGADVTAEPNGLAGELVPRGAVTDTAEMVPGTVHPPYSSLTRALERKAPRHAPHSGRCSRISESNLDQL